jgi:hypothetical protein
MTLTVKTMLEEFGYSVIGDKFPQEKRLRNMENHSRRGPGESEKQYQLREYLEAKKVKKDIKPNKDIQKVKEDLEKTKNMNPHGFWECRYTVQGCQWHIGIDKIVSGKKVCKIVSQGLPNTDPKYIDKMIFMIRKPGEVAKSQEDLKHDDRVEQIAKSDKNARVHQPNMFIQVSKQAARYFKETRIKPLIMDYDEYTSNPEKSIKAIIGYLGEGNYQKAFDCLDLKCKRSKDEKINGPKFELANEVYELMLKEDWEGVIKARMISDIEIRNFPCVRMQINVNSNHCKECQKCGDFTKDCIREANERDINWKELPCVFECGVDPSRKADDSYLTIEESSGEKNHWKTCQT